MARASVPTLLSLDRFARVLGLSPLHINQIEHGTCGDPIFQYAWQHPGRIGREDLAYAIHHAEALITDELGFYPLATWSEEVMAISGRMKNPVFVVGHGRIISGGKMAKTLIAAARPITYSDSDGDGVDDLATVTAVTTVTDIEQIALYYPGKAGAEEWEIRGLDVSISGGTATIRVPKWQLVTAEEQEALEPEIVDRDEPASFLETVDVYRKYNDPSVQAQFEGYQAPCIGCSGEGCESCTEVTQSACISRLDSVYPIVHLRAATWDAVDSRFLSAEWACGYDRPVRARIWIRSGWQDPRTATGRLTKMDPRLERAIALLALTQLGPEGLCVCISSIHERWNTDRALQLQGTETSTSYKMSKMDLLNPFGTTLGAKEAWRLVQEIKNG